MNKRNFSVLFLTAFLVCTSLLIGCSDDSDDESPSIQVVPKTYSISIGDCENGLVTASNSKASKGTVVTLYVTPSKGCALVVGSLSVKDKKGNNVELNNGTFKMPESDVTVSAAFRLDVKAPTDSNNNPLYSGGDSLYYYCDFLTEESNQPEQFIGTEIYYKIYNNYSSLTSQRSAILSVNTSQNTSDAATRMIESYTYQPLGRSVDTGNVVFIPETGGNRRVVFRVKNYRYGDGYTNDNDRYNFAACVRIGGGSYESYIPYRSGNSKSFDFFDFDEDDKDKKRDVEPKEGDDDYYYNSSGFSDGYDNTYFVQFFAVGKAWDSKNSSPAYSLVLDLGSVPIKKGE